MEVVKALVDPETLQDVSSATTFLLPFLSDLLPHLDSSLRTGDLIGSLEVVNYCVR